MTDLVTIRYFDERGYNSVQLPKTKKELYDKIGKDCFEEGKYDIYSVCVLGKDIEIFGENKTIEMYNLLAEKMDQLDRNNINKLQAIVYSENMFINKELQEFDPLNLCVFIDNLSNYKLHTNKANLYDEQLMRCEKVGTIGFLEHPKGDSVKFLINSDLYQDYKMPEDDPIVEIYLEEFIDVGVYGEEISIEMPLRTIVKDDLCTVDELDDKKQFKVKESFSNKVDFYMDYLVSRADLLDLNEFFEDFIKQPTEVQARFKQVYEMYNEIYAEGKYENGVPINEFKQVLKDIDNFEFLNGQEMRTAVVNSYLREKGVDNELREFIDYDRLYEMVFEESDIYYKNIYKGNYNTYVVDKDFYEEYLKEDYVVVQKEGEEIAEEQLEENNFEMGM